MPKPFQHTAARRRLVVKAQEEYTDYIVSTHSRPKAAGKAANTSKQAIQVSTHSRPKAAGLSMSFCRLSPTCFNTQPPEGGWGQIFTRHLKAMLFQHTAARRRLALLHPLHPQTVLCFNTQPPEGGWENAGALSVEHEVSTHSRPKAAGRKNSSRFVRVYVSTHSRPKAAGLCRY